MHIMPHINSTNFVKSIRLYLSNKKPNPSLRVGTLLVSSLLLLRQTAKNPKPVAHVHTHRFGRRGYPCRMLLAIHNDESINYLLCKAQEIQREC
jgi:hypothetical protein